MKSASSTDTTKVQKPKWEALSHSEVLQGDGFFISYNQKPGGGVSFFAADDDGEETALVVRGGGGNKMSGHSYLILRGDWRRDYEKLAAKGLKACKDFYKRKKKNHGSSWSQE